MRRVACLVVAACGGTAAVPPATDASAPDARALDAAGPDGGATGALAPAGGWPISSRCAELVDSVCGAVEAETWDRAGLVALRREESAVARLRDARGTVLAEVETSETWFDPWGLTALPDGGWALAGTSLGPSTLRVGTATFELPYAYNRVVVRVDGGLPTWHLVFEGQTDEVTLLAARTDGSVAVAGPESSDMTLGSFSLAGPVWVYDFFLAATTPAGAWAWAIDLPSPQSPLGDFQLGSLDLGPHSEVIATGHLRGTLSVAGHTVTGPVAARATASENGVWLDLAAAP